MDLLEYTAELEEANQIYSEAIKDPTIQEYMNLQKAEENISTTNEETNLDRLEEKLLKIKIKKAKRGIKL